MINVIYKKRALPIARIVVQGSKGHFPEETHRQRGTFALLPKLPNNEMLMPDYFLMALAEIQPSQLYISAEKLAHIMDWWHPPHLEMLPAVPIKRLNNWVIFTDGHTRAFAAYRQGFSEVPVFWDEDELDWEAYQICVDWCIEAGIHTVMDLKKCVLPPDDYEVLWLGRCREMQAALAAKRQLMLDGT